MEVKIKQGNEMLDATIEMVDDVMVVSPKVEKFEPKDGDVLSSDFKGKCQGTFVFEEASECGEAIFHFALDADGKFIKGNGCDYFGYIYDTRPATKEEKKKLFDKLAEEGLEFDFDKKELVKLKWKPKKEDRYFAPWIREEDGVHFFIDTLAWEDDSIDKELYEKGWVFKTEEECKAFVEKLNKTIESVKP